MFAAPLKSNNNDAAITTVFGKAKWFGIYNPADNSMKVIPHTEQGAAIIGKLKQEGVTCAVKNVKRDGCVQAFAGRSQFRYDNASSHDHLILTQTAIV